MTVPDSTSKNCMTGHGLAEWVGGQLLMRIRDYLATGGLFNPELMEHDKVRDLLLDCQKYIERTQPPNVLMSRRQNND